MEKTMVGIDNSFIRKYLPRWEWLVNMLEEQQIKQALRYSLPSDVVRSAESNPSDYFKTLEQIKTQWPDETQRVIKSLRNYLERSIIDHSSIDENDVLFCHFAYGFEPDEYCYYGVRSSTPVDEKRAFMTSRDISLFYKSMNHIIDRGIVGYKNHAYKLFKEFYRRDAFIPEKGKDDFDSFRSFAEKHRHAVRKEATGQCGELVEMVDFESINDLEGYYKDKVRGQSIIIEELIKQSEQMALLNRSSVNTIRYATLLIDDELIPLFSFLKIGRMGSFVDNGAQGGIVVNVDVNTGRLTAGGRTELGESFDYLPNTDLRIEDITLPDWAQLIELINEASRMCRTVPYIGWDMAHTDDGWVIVETNEGGSFIVQTPLQRGIKNELLRELNRGSSKRIDRTIRLLSS